MNNQLTESKIWTVAGGKTKNQTPRVLSLRAASSSAFLIGAALSICKLLGWLSTSWQLILVLCLIVLVIDYFSNYYYIQYYIYRKIKVIYKIIHKHKHSPDFKTAKTDMDRDLLAEVEAEVDEWEKTTAQDAAQLEELAAFRRQFVGNVSHELKTPIFNVQGYIHTLLDGAINDPAVNMNYLRKAARNADRLQAIVEDLDTVNRLENGQMILDIREFDLRALAEEVFADMEMKAREKEIRLLFKDGADDSFKVRADRDAIRQVLINLVQNSIKYGNKGGVTKLSFYDMDKYILIEVMDNGIGIDPRHHAHLFDRFFRVDKGRSRDVGGTGLGLSIVKHIIESHGQTITVRSVPGQGATFGFTLGKA